MKVILFLFQVTYLKWGERWRSCLSHCATRLEVSRSISGQIRGNFQVTYFFCPHSEALWVQCGRRIDLTTLSFYKKWKTNWCHCFNVIKYRRISTCFGPTGPSSGEFTQLFSQPLVTFIYCTTSNQWLWKELCEFSWRWPCGPETCRDPSIYE